MVSMTISPRLYSCVQCTACDCAYIKT